MLDVRAASFRGAREVALPSGYEANVCLRRLAKAGKIRRIRGGLYVVRDPVRETPAIAVASGVFAEVHHYVTTDAAVAHHGLIDQPIQTITVVISQSRRRFELDSATTIRPVTVDEARLRDADAYKTTVEGYDIRVASREQAVVDALAEPNWMIHGDLLAEILGAFTNAEVARTASGVFPLG